MADLRQLDFDVVGEFTDEHLSIFADLLVELVLAADARAAESEESD